MTTETAIVCSYCGASNPAGALYCQACSKRLAAGQAPERAATHGAPVTPGYREATTGPSWPGLVTATAATLLVLVVAGWVVREMGRLMERSVVGAPQVSQLYTQGAFWVLVAIALLLAGLLWMAATRR